MDGVCVRMMALFGDLCRNVMDRNDTVKYHYDHKNQQAEGEVVQEWIVKHLAHPICEEFRFWSQGTSLS